MAPSITLPAIVSYSMAAELPDPPPPPQPASRPSRHSTTMSAAGGGAALCSLVVARYPAHDMRQPIVIIIETSLRRGATAFLIHGNNRAEEAPVRKFPAPAQGATTGHPHDCD